MKTVLPPLPRTKDQWVTTDYVRELGFPFQTAITFQINFTQSDVDYIKKTIMTHKAFRFIKQNADNNRNDRRRCTTDIQFFSLFKNDKNCPENVRNFLCKYINWLHSCMNYYKKQIDVTEQFFIDRWLQTCH